MTEKTLNLRFCQLQKKNKATLGQQLLTKRAWIRFALRCTISFLDRVGADEISLRNDGEPAIVQLAKVVKALRLPKMNLEGAKLLNLAGATSGMKNVNILKRIGLITL